MKIPARPYGSSLESAAPGPTPATRSPHARLGELSLCDPHLKAFYNTLLARNKARLQVLIAVARNMIHAIYGMFQSKMPYDGGKLFPALN